MPPTKYNAVAINCTKCKTTDVKIVNTRMVRFEIKYMLYLMNPFAIVHPLNFHSPGDRLIRFQRPYFLGLRISYISAFKVVVLRNHPWLPH